MPCTDGKSFHAMHGSIDRRAQRKSFIAGASGLSRLFDELTHAKDESGTAEALWGAFVDEIWASCSIKMQNCQLHFVMTGKQLINDRIFPNGENNEIECFFMILQLLFNNKSLFTFDFAFILNRKVTPISQPLPL